MAVVYLVVTLLTVCHSFFPPGSAYLTEFLHVSLSLAKESNEASNQHNLAWLILIYLLIAMLEVARRLSGMDLTLCAYRW